MYSAWYSKIKKYDAVDISISNRNGKIAGKCYDGHSKCEECAFNYEKTAAFIVAHINKFVIYYYPVLRCINHNKQCSVYFKEKFIKNKLFLNKKMGDEIVNGPKFWSLSKYDEKNWDEGLNRKFHVDEEWLLALHRGVLVESYVLIYEYSLNIH